MRVAPMTHVPERRDAAGHGQDEVALTRRQGQQGLRAGVDPARPHGVGHVRADDEPDEGGEHQRSPPRWGVGRASCRGSARPPRVAGVGSTASPPAVGCTGRTLPSLLMKGLMQDVPLTITHLFDRAEQYFGHKGVTTATRHRAPARRPYAEWADRTRRLGGVLDALGISADGRVATFAWNTSRHLELYFAAPCTGRVLHTLNIRLFPEQLTYIVNHADDEVIFVDRSLLGLLAPLLPTFERLRHLVRHGRRQGRRPGRPERARAARLRGAARRRRARRVPRRSTRTRRRACATRAAPRATRRVSSTATAARSCTRWA